MANSAGMIYSVAPFKSCVFTVCFTIWAVFARADATQASDDNSARSPANVAPAKAELIGTYTLPRISLSQMGNPLVTEAALQRAEKDGLKYTDLISIGSGLEKAGENEFLGITDRGPNSHLKVSESSDEERRVSPLPEFCPAIVRFKLADGKIVPTQFIPFRDARGNCISGLSNVKGEEPLYKSLDAKEPLAFDQNGVDPEGIRLLPNGDFLLSEEYSPSIFVVSPKGEVLVRYTPASKPLPQATYPVKPILPDIFTQRRVNKGFENLALSRDGHFAYAILQSPMGDAHDKHFAKSRVIRVLKLDVSQPLEARVAGEYLALASAATDYSDKQKQSKLSWSDADWVAPDKLLVIERGHGLTKLLLVNFSGATDVLHHRDEGNLQFEDVRTDLAAIGVRPATATEVFSTRDVPGIKSDKIEGVAVLSPTEVALSNDNDFGIGENNAGEPSMVWLVRLTTPLPLNAQK